MTFPEAVADYERITGETFEWKPYEHLKILPTNEFMTYCIGEKDGTKYFEIRQTYAKYFRNFVPFVLEFV